MRYYVKLKPIQESTILEKSPWNTLGIFNKIKRVFLMWIKMINSGYWKKGGASTNAFTFPAPHHSMLRHSGDTLYTFAFFQHCTGEWGIDFPLKTGSCSKTFFEDCLSEILNFTSEIGFFIITLKLNVPLS